MLFVGTYQLGWRWVDLVIDPNRRGGSFEMRTGTEFDKEHPRPLMVIGGEYSVSDAYEVLVHEALEFVACEAGTRFRSTHAYATSASDVYMFMFDHNQLTEIAARVGNFIWQVKEDLEAGIKLLNE
jgi:hypothetical protein